MLKIVLFAVTLLCSFGLNAATSELASDNDLFKKISACFYEGMKPLIKTNKKVELNKNSLYDHIEEEDYDFDAIQDWFYTPKGSGADIDFIENTLDDMSGLSEYDELAEESRIVLRDCIRTAIKKNDYNRISIKVSFIPQDHGKYPYQSSVKSQCDIFKQMIKWSESQKIALFAENLYYKKETGKNRTTSAQYSIDSQKLIRDAFSNYINVGLLPRSDSKLSELQKKIVTNYSATAVLFALGYKNIEFQGTNLIGNHSVTGYVLNHYKKKDLNDNIKLKVHEAEYYGRELEALSNIKGYFESEEKPDIKEILSNLVDQEFKQPAFLSHPQT